MEYWGFDEQSRNANGGTELLKRALWNNLTTEEREKVHLICSRVRRVVRGKPNLLWLHDLAADPEARHLGDATLRTRFERLIFVTYWQWTQYEQMYRIPFKDTMIIPNFIRPFNSGVLVSKPTDGVTRLVYHTTPHRGLRLLVKMMPRIADIVDGDVHLDVFSSFNAYGWPERDREYADVFEACQTSPYITYHGFQPNEMVREYLELADFFLYPNIWQETSCLAAIEAMSAGVCVVAPMYGALPETCAPFSYLYPWTEDEDEHMNRALRAFEVAMDRKRTAQTFHHTLFRQKSIVDRKHSINHVIPQWRNLIDSL